MARQNLIWELAHDAQDAIANCSLNDNPEFRRFVDTWVKPHLAEIKRASNGEELY